MSFGKNWGIELRESPAAGDPPLMLRAAGAERSRPPLLRFAFLCCFTGTTLLPLCRERRAEPVLEKQVGNFCDYFEFALRDWTPKAGNNPRESAARDQLKKLFGD